jgi:ELWxxDGT repeat protein
MPPTTTRRANPIKASMLTILLSAASVATAQVRMVEDIGPGALGSGDFVAGALGSSILFRADNGTHGAELWISDGTAAGTFMVRDIWPVGEPDHHGVFSSAPGDFTTAGGLTYFTASGRENPDTGVADLELWTTDGTPGGTVSLDIWTGPATSFPSGLTEMGNALYLTALFEDTDGELFDTGLFRVAGTTVTLVLDPESYPEKLTAVDLDEDGTSDRLFFTMSEIAEGLEPWISDGTGAGTELLKDIRLGPEDADPAHFTDFAGSLWFRANDGIHGWELWRSDGSEGGTELFLDIDTLGSGAPERLVATASQLFFTADDGIHGRELWVSEGTVGGTGMIADFSGGPLPWEFNNMTSFGDELAFTTDDGTHGAELWLSDGTAAGTRMVKEIRPGPNGAGPSELTPAGDLLFFSANDDVHGRELWVSDGTEAGTVMVCDAADFWSVEGPTGLTVAGNLLFFQTDSDVGRELHVVETDDIVTPPSQVTVVGDLHSETMLTVSTGGSVSLKGNDVQYLFDWGDGTNSGWLNVGETSADHEWSEPGTYSVVARARSALDHSIGSCDSPERELTLTFNETIAPPDVTGPTSGDVGVSYNYTIVGASSLGHALEYTVDWGDGDSIGWTPLDTETNTALVSHAWPFAATHTVQVQIRCITHPAAVNWTDFGVVIGDAPEEVISEPALIGPGNGWTGHPTYFTVIGDANTDHQLQYRIDWGEEVVDWTDFPAGRSVELSATWSEAAEYYVIQVGVRCAEHDLQQWTDTTIEVVDPLQGAIFQDSFESSGLGAW